MIFRLTRFRPVLISLSLLCVAWSGSWESIKKTAQNIKSIRADFIQRKNLQMLSRPMISKGTFLYSSPESIRWEYFSPVRSILLMDKGKITRYVKHGGRFSEDSSGSLRAMQVVMNEIMNWIKGCFNCNSDFNTQLERGRVTLTPKTPAMKKIIGKIELTLSKTPGIIKSIKIFETGNNSTVILFQNAVLNRPIPRKLFQSYK